MPLFFHFASLAALREIICGMEGVRLGHDEPAAREGIHQRPEEQGEVGRRFRGGVAVGGGVVQKTFFKVMMEKCILC